MTAVTLLSLLLAAAPPLVARERVTSTPGVVLVSQTRAETKRGGLHLIGAIGLDGSIAAQLLDARGRARCSARGVIDLDTGEILASDGGCAGVGL